MTKEELRALNAVLIEMLVTMRDQIDEKLDPQTEFDGTAALLACRLNRIRYSVHLR